VLGMKIISLYQYSEIRKAIIINKAEFKEGVQLSSIHITENPRDQNKKYMLIDVTNLSSVAFIILLLLLLP
jgi:hypothetical protein